MVGVSYCGPFSEPSGYGAAARNNIRALQRVGADVFVDGPTFPLKKRTLPHPEPLRIIHYSPDSDPSQGTILYTVQELNAVPKRWVATLNRYSEVWVPSKWAKGLFVDAGVTTPITIIPHTVDERAFTPEVAPMHLDGPTSTVFLFVGHWMERKNAEGMLRAFLKAFDGNPRATLLLRSHANPGNGDPSAMIENAVRRLMREEGISRPPPVHWVPPVSEADLPSLYAAADCLLFPVRCEGFGVPLIEAMASGKPIITTDWPAMNEVASRGCARLVPAEPTHPGAGMDWSGSYEVTEDTRWAEPDEDMLIEALRAAEASPQDCQEMGENGRKRFLEHFSMVSVGTLMKKRLEAISWT